MRKDKDGEDSSKVAREWVILERDEYELATEQPVGPRAYGLKEQLRTDAASPLAGFAWVAFLAALAVGVWLNEPWLWGAAAIVGSQLFLGARQAVRLRRDGVALRVVVRELSGPKFGSRRFHRMRATTTDRDWVVAFAVDEELAGPLLADHGALELLAVGLLPDLKNVMVVAMHGVAPLHPAAPLPSGLTLADETGVA